MQVTSSRVRFKSTALVCWTDGESFNGTETVGLGQASAQELEVNSGTLGDLRDLKIRNLTATKVASHAPYRITYSTAESFEVGDDGGGVMTNSSDTNILILPAHGEIPIPIGAVINVFQNGTGTTTITATSGVELRSRGGAVALAGQYAAATLYKYGEAEWFLVGDLI